MGKKSPASERVQLSVAELNQLRWLLGGVVILVSAWSVFYLDVNAWALAAMITLTTIAGWIWPRLPGRVPMFLHTFAFPLIVALFLTDLWLEGNTLSAIVRLAMLLMFYRGISYRQRRDDLQIVVLGLFLIVVAGVLTVSMMFAVQLLAFAACSLGLLLVLTLLQGMEEGRPPVARGAMPPWVDIRWQRLFVRVRSVTDWRVVALAALLFLGVVGVSAVLFVTIPRFQLQNSLFLERFIEQKARTGFSETIKFGDVTEIQQDNTVALSVDVTDRNQVPASAYWRMLVLDQYEKGGIFKLSATLRGGFEAPRTDLLLRGTARQAKPVAWTFYLESGVGKYLPLVGAFTQLQFTDLQNYQFSRAIGVLGLRDNPATMTAYRVEGFDHPDALADPDFALQWRNQKVASSAQLQMGLDALNPVDRATLDRVASEISAAPLDASRRGSPATNFIGQATAWLRAHHGYSLAPRIPAGGDPLVQWLTSRESGHCELFAGSLVLLARSAGFPARVVTGFRGGSWNGYSNSLTVRYSDAHAWAEIFDEDSGAWLRADALEAPVATERGAAAAGLRAPMRRVDRGWSARVESLRVFWYRRIVSFDRRSQVETLKAIKGTTEDAGRRLREQLRRWFAEMKQWLTRPWDLTRAFRWFALAAGLWVFRWAWREFGRPAWQQWIRRRQGGRQVDPIRVDASRWIGKLATLQLTETAEHRAVREDLQRLRFGARPNWPEPRQVFHRAKNVARGARRFSVKA